MKKFACVLLCMVPWSANGIPGGLPVGETCYVETDVVGRKSSECDDGLVCFFNQTAGYGYCIADCSIFNTMPSQVSVEQGRRLGFVGSSNGGVEYASVLCVMCTDYETCPRGQYKYFCGPRAYGTSNDGKTGCTNCPGDGTANPTNTIIGGKEITDCYLPANTETSDATGAFSVSGECPYVK